MYADLGILFLYLALIFSVMLSFTPCFKLNQNYIKAGWYLLFSFTSTAFICLIACFVISDFTVVNVVNNSHTDKPLLYKISGAWGNHEGSMLMWICALTFFSAIFAYQQQISSKLIQHTLAIQAILLTFFISFTIFTSNPFERAFPAPLNGFGLNPILQDIGLAMHPPMLYLGYVGFSLIYSGAIAALINGKLEQSFALIFKPYLLLSWTFLTLGIGLGSWWAYRELGWGGFWFWDPVENSSLLPWLTATALIHTLMVLRKFQKLKHWNLLLSIMTFTFSMIGTFLVRSNLITSVHAFAQDPKRGVFILLFLGIATSSALLLYAIRSPKIVNSDTQEDYLFSRQMFIVLNSLVLSITAFVIIFGTLYPSVLELLTGQKISVGPPYFNALIGPLALVLSLLTIVGTLIRWGKTPINSIINTHKKPFCLSVFISALFCYVNHVSSFLAILGIFLGIWLIITIIFYLISRRNTLNFGLLSMGLAHLGFGLLVLALTINISLEKESEKALKLNETISCGQYQFTLMDITLKRGENYIARIAKFKVSKEEKFLTNLFPETRFFPVELQQTTEAALYHSLFYDLYLATGQLSDEGMLMVRAYYKPGISFIWIACILIVLGGVLAIIRSLKAHTITKKD